MSETMTEASIFDLLRTLNATLAELNRRGAPVTAREVKSEAGPGVILIIDNVALMNGRIIGVCR